jgi:hypothetical protein
MSDLNAAAKAVGAAAGMATHSGEGGFADEVALYNMKKRKRDKREGKQRE